MSRRGRAILPSPPSAALCLPGKVIMSEGRHVDRTPAAIFAPDYEPAVPSPQAEIVTGYYKLVDANDVEALLGLFSDACTYHRPGYQPICGKQALRDFYTSERIIDHGTHTLNEVLVADNAVAVRGAFVGTLRDARPASVRFADFFHLDRDMTIDARWTYFDAPAV